MNEEAKKLMKLIVGIVFVILLVVVVIGSFEEIPAGHKGVIMNSPSGPSNVEIPEGWNFDTGYLVSDIVHVEWRTQKMAFVGSDLAEADVGSIVLSSKDNIKVYIDFNIIYHVDPEFVAELVIENGVDYKERIINPTARSIPRNVGAQYDAIDIRGTKRVEVEFAMADNMTQVLAEKHIIVEAFTLQDVRLPAALEAAIERKKIAEQNVLTQEYNLAAEAHVANKTIVQMDAEAAAILLNATAQRNATILRATGEAEAVRMVMQALNASYGNETAMYLQYVYLQALMDPNSNIKFIIVPSDGQMPIIMDVRE